MKASPACAGCARPRAQGQPNDPARGELASQAARRPSGTRGTVSKPRSGRRATVRMSTRVLRSRVRGSSSTTAGLGVAGDMRWRPRPCSGCRACASRCADRQPCAPAWCLSLSRHSSRYSRVGRTGRWPRSSWCWSDGSARLLWPCERRPCKASKCTISSGPSADEETRVERQQGGSFCGRFFVPRQLAFRRTTSFGSSFPTRRARASCRNTNRPGSPLQKAGTSDREPPARLGRRLRTCGFAGRRYATGPTA